MTEVWSWMAFKELKSSCLIREKEKNICHFQQRDYLIVMHFQINKFISG